MYVALNQLSRGTEPHHISKEVIVWKIASWLGRNYNARKGKKLGLFGKNFYDDELPKPTPDAQFTVILIKRVTKICKTYGFKSYRFISNNNEVLKCCQRCCS